MRPSGSLRRPLGLPGRLLIAVAAFAATVVVAVIVVRITDEGSRFLGQPCREVDEEAVAAPTLLEAAVAEPESEEVSPLPAPARAQGGEPAMQEGPEATLAHRYEPILEVAKADRFWPVPVPTVFDLELGERFTRFVSRHRTSPHAQLSDLGSGGGERQYLDYPAAVDHVQDQFCSVGHALRIPARYLARWRTDPDLLEPSRSAQFYFFDHPVGRRGKDLQYWFFYPLNYLPEVTDDFTFLDDPIAAIAANVDFHEGDFEHVTVQLRWKTGRLAPADIVMARHKGEDKPIPWNSPSLERVGGHPVVYAGFGGHASYEDCGPQVRQALGFIPLVDWTLCGEGQSFVFGQQTPLVDLRGVSWPCWPGHFGERPPHPVSELLVEGPRSPYFQDDADLRAQLCPPH